MRIPAAGILFHTSSTTGCRDAIHDVNINKCNQMSYDAKHKIDTDYYIISTNTTHHIQKVTNIKDLGVTFDPHLSFQQHMQEKINKAYSMIGIIKRNFIRVDSNTFCLLYKALVRPHLEYAHSVWCLHKKGDITEIEK